MAETSTAPRTARDQRLRLGLTLRGLAARCTAEGVPASYSQLAKIEKGYCAPRPALRAKLAEILDLDPMTFSRIPGAPR